MKRYLRDFPWLWALNDYWEAEAVTIKVRRINSIHLEKIPIVPGNVVAVCVSVNIGEHFAVYRTVAETTSTLFESIPEHGTMFIDYLAVIVHERSLGEKYITIYRSVSGYWE